MNSQVQGQRAIQRTERTLRTDWERDGFVILRHFYSRNQVQTINHLVDRLWRERETLQAPITIDAHLESPEQRRGLLRDMPEAARRVPYKVNDLYLDCEEIRRVALSLRLCDVLSELLEGTPLLCNTQNFEHGSRQPDHVDSLHMAPRRPDAMIGCWIALDPVTTSNGPVRYYPGSHRIPSWQFAGGGPGARPGDRKEWQQYIRREVRERGIHPRIFTAQPGDILIWHSRLLHGGSRIQEPGHTRRSMAAHYFRQQDYRHHLWRVRRRHENGYLYQRRHALAS